MATLKDEAQAYVPQQTLNIADLEKVPVSIDLKDAEGTDNTGKVFKYKYFEHEGQKYRVPGSVIGDLKGILQKQPNVTHVSVTKTGTGMNTRYQVIPCTDAQPQTEQVN